MKMKIFKIKLIFIILILILLLLTCFTYFNIKKTQEAKEKTFIQDIFLDSEEGINDILNLNQSLNLEGEIQLFGNEIQNEENSQSENIVEPHVDTITGRKYVTYEDFGAQSDANFDNYKSIKATHDYANKYGYDVKSNSSVYHIYKLEDTSPIVIKTNTNWNNANFIIHDENIKNQSTKSYSIF